MSDELRILLTGYLDGELPPAERARVEEALAGDDALRRELAEMRRLKELTRALAADERGAAELEAFWGSVYNRLERRTAWVLLVSGAGGLFALGSVVFFLDPRTFWGVKVAAGLAGAGLAGLFLSVLRERLRALPHDRYTREVHR